VFQKSSLDYSKWVWFAKCFLAILSAFIGVSSLKVETEQILKIFRQITGMHGTPLRNEQKVKNVRAKNTKLLFFIGKYANLGRSCRRRRHGSLSFLFSVEI